MSVITIEYSAFYSLVSAFSMLNLSDIAIPTRFTLEIMCIIIFSVSPLICRLYFTSYAHMIGFSTIVYSQRPRGSSSRHIISHWITCFEISNAFRSSMHKQLTRQLIIHDETKDSSSGFLEIFET